MTTVHSIKALRTTVVALTAGATLSLPMAASAVGTAMPQQAPAAAQQEATKYATKVVFRPFDHTRRFGSPTHVRGQVTVPALGGAVKGLRVKLYRKIHGSPNWKYLATKYTSHKNVPLFTFRVKSVANADYRVVYEGNKHLKRSRNATTVSVYRKFNAKIDDGSGRFHGRVTPRYGHRKVYLEKRSCANCGWHRVRSDRTGAHGLFSFIVGAPRHGRWWWRSSTPASPRFITSYSGVFSTHRG